MGNLATLLKYFPTLLKWLPTILRLLPMVIAAFHEIEKALEAGGQVPSPSPAPVTTKKDVAQQIKEHGLVRLLEILKHLRGK